MEVFCCLTCCVFEVKILFYVQTLVWKQIFTFISVFVWKLSRFQEFKVIRAMTVKSYVWTTLCPNFDLTVKALMISNSLYHRNFQMSADMNVKISSYTKLCTQNNILASKM